MQKKLIAQIELERLELEERACASKSSISAVTSSVRAKTNKPLYYTPAETTANVVSLGQLPSGTQLVSIDKSSMSLSTLGVPGLAPLNPLGNMATQNDPWIENESDQLGSMNPQIKVHYNILNHGCNIGSVGITCVDVRSHSEQAVGAGTRACHGMGHDQCESRR